MNSDSNTTYGLGKGILKVIRVWARGRPSKIVTLWRRYRTFQKANEHRRQYGKEYHVTVPPLLIFSATMRCNLSCIGCYSRDYPMDGEMRLEEIDSLFQQAGELGVGFFVVTGGEPLLRKGLTELMIQHKKLIFLLFTNGSYIDRSWAKTIGRSDNVIPILSLEGTEKETDERREMGVHEQVMKSMSYLKEAGAFFGFSAMITRKNLHVVSQDLFYDDLIQRGCRIGFCIGYVPSGADADFDLVPTPKEQERLRQHMLDFQSQKPLILVHMPDDEYEQGVCMAAGRGFLHVNAQGFVEPCPFAHLASHSLRTHSLLECLKSPLFSYIREHPELLRPPRMGCALFEHRRELEVIAKEVGAKSTENKRSRASSKGQWV